MSPSLAFALVALILLGAVMLSIMLAFAMVIHLDGYRNPPEITPPPKEPKP